MENAKLSDKEILFIDTEISIETHRILDVGAIANDDTYIHSGNLRNFKNLAVKYDYVCGHNIVSHDLKYIGHLLNDNTKIIDTLYLSAILYPQKLFHKILKDDKIRSFEKNNPLADAKKTKELFYIEVNAFNSLDEELKQILYLLTSKIDGLNGFFSFLNYSYSGDVKAIIRRYFRNDICLNNIDRYISAKPLELAFVLINIASKNSNSFIAPWISINYPDTQEILHTLRSTPCSNFFCTYCRREFNYRKQLKKYFGFDDFRLFDGRHVQEELVGNAVQGKSFVAVLPTGGGKSLCFQLPALISGEEERGLTVVISPLQALMMDQVKNLEDKGRVEAVTINGMMNPIERKEAIERIENGVAKIIYISPESLRSNTIKRLLKLRRVSRFVIDEAHCFSSWGQDFRVEYLYIGKFIRRLQDEEGLGRHIPVSCYTATASTLVINDIISYFQAELDLKMESIVVSPKRKNLSYQANRVSEEDKYAQLRNILSSKKCPTVVYTFSVAKTHEIAARLSSDGINAVPYNGKMDPEVKKVNQDAFINGDVQVIVATSAFGMGIDKDNIELVVHYQMPTSIEDYLQEAGRAARNEKLFGQCIILYSEVDADFFFYNLNQTKLSFQEIQSVWSAIKKISGGRQIICKSARELAEVAGFLDTSYRDADIVVKAAINALEVAGYIERLDNSSYVYASAIIPRSMTAAVKLIDESKLFSSEDKQIAVLLIQELIGSSYRAKAGNADNSKYTDYLAELFGVEHKKLLDVIQLLKEANILTNDNDLSVFIPKDITEKNIRKSLSKFVKLEEFLLENLPWEAQIIEYKSINEKAKGYGLGDVTPPNINKIITYWASRAYIKIEKHDNNCIEISMQADKSKLLADFNQRKKVCDFIVTYIFELQKKYNKDKVSFSLIELKRAYENQHSLFAGQLFATTNEMKEALIYIDKLKVLQLEGGFFVLYQPYRIKRLEMNNRIKYKIDDYAGYKFFYKQKIRQIHIMKLYTDMLRMNPTKANAFIEDYFKLDQKIFDDKYLTKEQIKAIKMNITSEKYEEMFGKLSETQKKIIDDDESQNILVAAGPGSGKTMLLVHKLASLILLEDIKTEKLLMLTFSRQAATEFRERLVKLIGKAGYGVEIKTFHSYCFDILGRKGNLIDSENIVSEAIRMIKDGEVEANRITKDVLVVDEAQDISRTEYELLKLIVEQNDEIRTILVGDDDQNIYEFRGSSSKYMSEFAKLNHATLYDMTENYRSTKSIVEFTNIYVNQLKNRIKQHPSVSMVADNGYVQITKFKSSNLELPLVNEILNQKSHKSTCVLTATNAEALRVVGALEEKGLRARLIQSNDDVTLDNILELSAFKSYIESKCITPIISDEIWSKANDMLKYYFSTSHIYDTCKKIIRTFEKSNPIKYKTDLYEFLYESKFEDFIESRSDEITVSTIHKSKGREFEKVYLVLNNVTVQDGEDIRKLYVGMTRAKRVLHIMCNNNAVDHMEKYCNIYKEDNKLYDQPPRTTLQLGYKDLFLDTFIDNQEAIKRIRSGYKLLIKNQNIFACEGNKKIKIGALSRKALNDMQHLTSYEYYSSGVRFVVYWKKKDSEEKYLVPLPNLDFKKR